MVDFVYWSIMLGVLILLIMTIMSRQRIVRNIYTNHKQIYEKNYSIKEGETINILYFFRPISRPLNWNILFTNKLFLNNELRRKIWTFRLLNLTTIILFLFLIFGLR
jgi:hypothetical protein